MKALPDAMKPREEGLAKTKPNETQTPPCFQLCNRRSYIILGSKHCCTKYLSNLLRYVKKGDSVPI
jgi:hypothetical protein